MTEALTSTILEDVGVLSIGRLTEAQSLSSTDSKGGTSTSSSPSLSTSSGNVNRAATLLVTPEQSRKLELAKNQGKISLALRNPLDKTISLDENATVSGESLDPLMYARLARARGGRVRNMGALPNMKDNAAWAKLIGDDDPPKVIRAPVSVAPPAKPAPPPPRAVIDVYRGDKHVQEIFHD